MPLETVAASARTGARTSASVVATWRATLSTHGEAERKTTRRSGRYVYSQTFIFVLTLEIGALEPPRDETLAAPDVLRGAGQPQHEDRRRHSLAP